MVNWTKGDEAVFTIGVVSKMLEINPQTLRIYEKRGLIEPSRSKGNTRLYSHVDVEKIRIIIRLTQELDVNLAGVEVVFNLLNRIQNLEEEFGNVVKNIMQRLMNDIDSYVSPEDGALVPLRSNVTKLKIVKKS